MVKSYHKEPMVVRAMKLEESDGSIIEALNFIGEDNYPLLDRGKSFRTLIASAKTRGGIELYGQNEVTEGIVLAGFGDYIVKEANSTFYTVSAALFEKYYHEAEESE